MSRKNYYRNLDDLSMRHRDTYVGIVTDDGVEAFRVDGVDRSGSDYFLVLEDRGSVNIEEPNLIIERPLVGFTNMRINGEDVAVWSYTNADRQIKKSLNLSVYNSVIIGRNRNISPNPRVAQAAYSNTYPTYEEAVRAVTTSTFSKAFHKYFALSLDRSGSIVVYYKNRKVGYLTDDQGSITLFNNFGYLQEQLEEIVDVNVAIA